MSIFLQDEPGNKKFESYKSCCDKKNDGYDGAVGNTLGGKCISGEVGLVGDTSDRGCITGKSIFDEDNNFFDRAYKSLCRMQQTKNAKYGNSALKPLDIFAKHHTYGSRIDEKLARVKYSEILRKNDVADIIGGLMLLCKEKGWDSFEDLID